MTEFHFIDVAFELNGFMGVLNPALDVQSGMRKKGLAAYSCNSIHINTSLFSHCVDNVS